MNGLTSDLFYCRVSEPMTFMSFYIELYGPNARRSLVGHNVFAITSPRIERQASVLVLSRSPHVYRARNRSPIDGVAKRERFAAMGARSVSSFAELACNSRNRGQLVPGEQPTTNWTGEDNIGERRV